MGLFTQLEKFDQKLTRGYARWGQEKPRPAAAARVRRLQ